MGGRKDFAEYEQILPANVAVSGGKKPLKTSEMAFTVLTLHCYWCLHGNSARINGNKYLIMKRQCLEAGISSKVRLSIREPLRPKEK